MGYDASMGNFHGGSAYAMANQIADGVVLCTERTFKRLQRAELDKLSFELDKLLRSVRGDQPELDDTRAVQARNRKIMRLKGAQSMLRSYRARQQRGQSPHR